MKILCVSDEVVPAVYHVSSRERFGDAELILGCGDLPPSYLEYIVSTLNRPCYYVPGNHDGVAEQTDHGSSQVWPSGATNIHGRVVRESGILIGGLGGSVWYNGGQFQYTQRDMMLRLYALLPRILWARRLNGFGLDVFVSHAPPQGIHDGTGAHAGFRAFRWLIDRYPPRFFIHGHIHRNYRISPQVETRVGQTLVINAAGYHVLTVEPRVAEQHLQQQ